MHIQTLFLEKHSISTQPWTLSLCTQPS